MSPRDVPSLNKERYLAYEWRSGEARVLNLDEKVEGVLEGLDFNFFLAPVEEGLAFIGNTKKILSPRFLKRIQKAENGYLVFLEEEGSVMLYSDRKIELYSLDGRVLRAIRKGPLHPVDAPAIFRVRMS